MADVSAETVLEAAIVSTAELSFLLHAASANAAMAIVATLYPDPFLNISFSLPQGRERGRSIVAAPFVSGGVSGKKRTHQPLLVIAFAPRGHFGLSPDVVPNPCFLLQFPVRVRKARRRTLFHHRSHAHPSSLHHRTVTRCGNGAESSVARRTPANHLSGQAVPARC